MKKMLICLLLLALSINTVCASLEEIPIKQNISGFTYGDTLAVSTSEYNRRVVSYFIEDQIYHVFIMQYSSYAVLEATILANLEEPYVLETYKEKEIMVHHMDSGDIYKWSDGDYLIDVDSGDIQTIAPLVDAYMEKIPNKLDEIVKEKCDDVSDCDDEDVSTKDTCVGYEYKYCENKKITTCISDDNYCPSGCHFDKDTDCNQCSKASDCYTGDPTARLECKGSPKRCYEYEMSESDKNKNVTAENATNDSEVKNTTNDSEEDSIIRLNTAEEKDKTQSSSFLQKIINWFRNLFS